MDLAPIVATLDDAGRRTRITIPISASIGPVADDGRSVKISIAVGAVTAANAPPRLGAAAPTAGDLAALEQAIGRQLDLVRIYHDAHDTALAKPLLDTKAQWALAGGRNIHISFTSNWADTAAGKLDAQLAGYARELAGWPAAIVTWCHEGIDTYRAGQDLAAFAAGHRHVVDVLRANGARNPVAYVTQAWSWRDGGPALASLPPAGYVDLVGADGYSWPGKPFPASAVFGPFLAAAARLGIPACVPEFNVGPDQDRAAWLAAAWTTFTAAGVAHACLFDVNDTGNKADWRIPAGPVAAAIGGLAR